MTTDTALALLAEAKEQLNKYRASVGHLKGYDMHLVNRITALLDSGIKDAGDDVVEPVRDEYECYDHYVDALKDYADHLLSAYKRACVERDKWEKEADGQFKYAGRLLDERNKAESEREQLIEKVKYYESITTGAEHKAIDAAIDSARNK